MFEIPEQIIHEAVNGETMIVKLDTGNYYSLNTTGGEVWTLIEKGASESQILTRIAELYGIDQNTATETIKSFLNHLIQEGLIFPDGVSRDAGAGLLSGTITNQTNSFEPPLLQKYSDMQELLILDPIHEVSEAGWPNPKSGSKHNE